MRVQGGFNNRSQNNEVDHRTYTNRTSPYYEESLHLSDTLHEPPSPKLSLEHREYLLSIANHERDIGSMGEIFQTLHSTTYHERFSHVTKIFSKCKENLLKQYMELTLSIQCSAIIDFQNHFTSSSLLNSQLKNKKYKLTPTHAVEYLTTYQCFILLSSAFFCILNDSFSFEYFFYYDIPQQIQKLNCMLNYFNTISTYIDKGDTNRLNNVVAFELLPHCSQQWLHSNHSNTNEFLWNTQTWLDCEALLTPIHVVPPIDSDQRTSVQFDKRIESSNQIQADFANKRIGGGVLKRGCVQEEIRLMLSPEYLCAIWLTYSLKSDEALLMSGGDIFSNYDGYSSSFLFSDTPFPPIKELHTLFLQREERGTITRIDKEFDKSSRVQCRQLRNYLLAIDAIPFRSEEEKRSQFTAALMIRDLNKVRHGLMLDESLWTSSVNYREEEKLAFATGKWGAGAFGGDAELKAILQWLSCSATGRKMIFYCWDSTEMMMLEQISYHLSKRRTVGELFSFLIENSSRFELSKPGFERQQVSERIQFTVFHLIRNEFK